MSVTWSSSEPATVERVSVAFIARVCQEHEVTALGHGMIVWGLTWLWQYCRNRAITSPECTHASGRREVLILRDLIHGMQTVPLRREQDDLALFPCRQGFGLV